MTSLAERLARPEILALPPFDLSANANSLFARDAVRLDANENPYPPLGTDAFSAGLNRYPEPQPGHLVAAMAALYGVGSDELLVTRGADDAIDVLVRTFCRPSVDAVSICPPTFAAYAHFALLQGARVIEAPLGEDFALDPDALLARLGAESSLKLAFLCSPNNPTGNVVPRAEIIRIADALPETILVLDEAYVEFADVESLAAEAVRRPNLVVLRTLSKAFGLAGARVGALLGNRETIALAARAMAPYPLPSLSIAAATAALAPARRPLHQERIERIKADRARLAPLLAAAPGVEKVRSGGANFLFLEVAEPAELAARLRQAGVRVRFRPNAAPGGVRVSIGTDAENAALLAALGVAAETPQRRRAELVRETKETSIAVAVDLDAASPRKVDTGVAFFDHMLDQVAAHGNFSLLLDCKGDLEIDAHHSLEDCAIAFGQALSKALAERRGIGRFGFALPMDEAEAQVLIDLSGRPYAKFEGEFAASHIGAYPTEMVPHIFRSIADSLGGAIHVSVKGDNDHHKVEACFKAFGRALRHGLAIEGGGDALPSTKGVL